MFIYLHACSHLPRRHGIQHRGLLSPGTLAEVAHPGEEEGSDTAHRFYPDTQPIPPCAPPLIAAVREAGFAFLSGNHALWADAYQISASHNI